MVNFTGKKTGIYLTSCIRGGNTDRRPGWLIQFEYDPEVIELLKTQVHYSDRGWNERTKTWWVSEDCEDILEALFDNWYTLAKRQGALF
uniref:Uncharacterized protein n=1 Tax=viral metagenome TaxID=1070528 RepID=A0A6M3KP47_9ZZZZ